MKRLSIVMFLVLAGCAHNPENTYTDLVAADKQCQSQPTQSWPNMVARTNCSDSVEIPVIKRDNPVILQSFETFSSKRKLLSQQYDNEKAPIMAAWQAFQQGNNEAAAVLQAHAPIWVTPDSTLNKDISAANLNTACPSQIFVTRMKCYDSIMHTIWERDAPDTVKYYEEFHKKRLQLAKAYDAIGVPKIAVVADDHFQKGLQKAFNEFLADARLAIQQQQTADAIQRQQTADALGQIAQALLQGIAIAAQARANADAAALQAQPQHTVCRNYGGTIYCDTY